MVVRWRRSILALSRSCPHAGSGLCPRKWRRRLGFTVFPRKASCVAPWPASRPGGPVQSAQDSLRMSSEGTIWPLPRGPLSGTHRVDGDVRLRGPRAPSAGRQRGRAEVHRPPPYRPQRPPGADVQSGPRRGRRLRPIGSSLSRPGLIVRRQGSSTGRDVR